jgi:hypothetical protein
MKSKSKLFNFSKKSSLFFNFSGCKISIFFSRARVFTGVGIISFFLQIGLSAWETISFTSREFLLSKIFFKIFFENSQVQKNAIFILFY